MGCFDGCDEGCRVGCLDGRDVGCRDGCAAITGVKVRNCNKVRINQVCIVDAMNNDRLSNLYIVT